MNFSRLIAINTAALALFACPLVAAAQVAPDTNSSVGAAAGLAARDAVLARKRREALAQVVPGESKGTAPAPSAAPAVDGTVPPPITDADVSKPGFLGDRFTYEADLSSMYQGGNTLRPNSRLPGGVDANLLYKIGRTTRLSASYYQFSATSVGNDDPNVPIVFQGTTTPIGTFNAGAAGVDASTHLRFQIYNLQQMFTVGGRHHPIVFAPTYASIRSIIAGKDDAGTLFANGQILTVHQRSYEIKALNLAIPLFYAENYLITYTGGVVWNVNTNGANLTNHPQYSQSLYTQYEPDDSTTFFASGSKAITYFPTDVYPYNSPTVHMGVAKKFAKRFFFEGEISTGGPSNPNYTNIGRVGLVDLTVPCPRTAAGGPPTLTCVALAQNGVAVPVIGAQRFTTFTLMFGIGAAPLVRPF